MSWDKANTVLKSQSSYILFYNNINIVFFSKYSTYFNTCSIKHHIVLRNLYDIFKEEEHF